MLRLTPVMDDDIAGSDLERYQSCLEDEEVPAGGETEALINVAASESNEGARDGRQGYHFGHAHGHSQDEGAPDGEGQEQRGRATVQQAAANLDVEGGADGATDSDELNVPTLQLPCRVVAGSR